MINRKYPIKFCITIFTLLIIFIQLSFAESAYGAPIINKDTYIISRSIVQRDITKGEIFRDSIKISNLKDEQIKISVSSSSEIAEIIELESIGSLIGPNNSTN